MAKRESAAVASAAAAAAAGFDDVGDTSATPLAFAAPLEELEFGFFVSEMAAAAFRLSFFLRFASVLVLHDPAVLELSLPPLLPSSCQTEFLP